MRFQITKDVEVKNCNTCPLSHRSVPEQEELPMQIYCTARSPKSKSHWVNVTRQAYGNFPPYRCPLHDKTRKETEELLKERIKW